MGGKSQQNTKDKPSNELLKKVTRLSDYQKDKNKLAKDQSALKR